mgnify:CR=1 FL=1
MLRRAQELQAARLRYIGPLASALSERTALQQQLDEVNSRYSTAYNDALKNGWSAEELRTIGAEEPEQRPRGRQARRRPTRKRAAAAPSSSAQVPTQQGAPDGEPATVAPESA